MADGSLRPLEHVREGERVLTRTRQQGVVTRVLSTRVNATVRTASMRARTEVLVGNPLHPVHVNGTWLQLDRVAQRELAPVTIGASHVDTWYNLEIDGGCVHCSDHSYVLDGVAVSGLGNHPVLNRVFAREERFQQKNV